MRKLLVTLAALLLVVLLVEAVVVLLSCRRAVRLMEARDDLRGEVSRLESHLRLDEEVERQRWVVDRKLRLAGCLEKEGVLAPADAAEIARLRDAFEEVRR
jgi:hypothetical protein